MGTERKVSKSSFQPYPSEFCQLNSFGDNARNVLNRAHETARFPRRERERSLQGQFDLNQVAACASLQKLKFGAPRGQRLNGWTDRADFIIC